MSPQDNNTHPEEVNIDSSVREDIRATLDTDVTD